MNEPILDQQLDYYRARAEEYDASILPAIELLKPARDLLLQLGRFETILELACGTGIWTATLLELGDRVTAVDAAPEMLAIARAKLGAERIHYQQINLFEWEPVQTYDLVFCANWLSHVPPDLLDEFLGKVQRSVHPGGYLALLDQHAPSDADRQIAKDDIFATRPLADGRQFTIVKAFYDLPQLQHKLEALGFKTNTHMFADTFFFLTAQNTRSG